MRVWGGALRRLAHHDDAVRLILAQRGGGHEVHTIGMDGAPAQDAIEVPEGQALPEPWTDRVYTRLWVQGDHADLLRRDAALRPVGEPITVGEAAARSSGAVVWGGGAFLAVWPNAANAVTLRAITCEPAG